MAAHDTVARAQREAEERSKGALGAQLSEKDDVIGSLEKQLKVAREELRAQQTTSEGSNLTLKNYRERLLNASEEMGRLAELNKARNEENEAMKAELEKADGFRKELREKGALIGDLKAQIEECKNQLRERDEAARSLKSQKENIELSLRQKLADERENAVRETTAEYEQRIQKLLESRSEKEHVEGDSLHRANESLRSEVERLRNEVEGLRRQL